MLSAVARVAGAWPGGAVRRREQRVPRAMGEDRAAAMRPRRALRRPGAARCPTVRRRSVQPRRDLRGDRRRSPTGATARASPTMPAAAQAVMAVDTLLNAPGARRTRDRGGGGRDPRARSTAPTTRCASPTATTRCAFRAALGGSRRRRRGAPLRRTSGRDLAARRRRAGCCASLRRWRVGGGGGGGTPAPAPAAAPPAPQRGLCRAGAEVAERRRRAADPRPGDRRGEGAQPAVDHRGDRPRRQRARRSTSMTGARTTMLTSRLTATGVLNNPDVDAQGLDGRRRPMRRDRQGDHRRLPVERRATRSRPAPRA